MKIYIYIAIAIVVAGIAGGIYWKIYNSGKTAVYIEQEKKLNTIKSKTNAAKTEALTATPSTVDDELLKYARPD